MGSGGNSVLRRPWGGISHRPSGGWGRSGDGPPALPGFSNRRSDQPGRLCHRGGHQFDGHDFYRRVLIRASIGKTGCWTATSWCRRQPRDDVGFVEIGAHVMVASEGRLVRPGVRAPFLWAMAASLYLPEARPRPQDFIVPSGRYRAGFGGHRSLCPAHSPLFSASAGPPCWFRP